MSETFKRLKKNFFITVLIKSLAAGLAVGLFLVGVVLLPLKLTNTEVSAWYYVLIGVGGFIFAGAIVFLCLYRTEIKLAKELDTKFALGEKIQTMLEFRNEEGFMLELQRSNASETLAALPLKKPWWKQFGVSVATSVLAVAVAVTAIALPSKSAQGDEEAPAITMFQMSDVQKTAFKDMIKNVEESELDSDLKTSVVTTLNSLYDSLQAEQPEEKMESAVDDSIGLIDVSFAVTYTYIPIALTLDKYGMSHLAHAVNDYTTGYKSIAFEPDNYDSVKLRAAMIGDTLFSNLSDLLIKSDNAYRVMFTIPAEGDATELDLINVLADGETDEVSEVLVERNIGSDISNCLLNLGTVFSGLEDISEEDLVIVSLHDFYDGMKEIVPLVEDYSYEYVQDKIDKVFSETVTSLSDSLRIQSYNSLMNEYIRSRLPKILKIELSLNGLGGVNLPPISSNNSNGSGEGGGGSGEILYGSNDFIFDPDSGERVPYGNLFDEYYARVLEQLRENDNMSEELKASIYKYFTLLRGSDNSDD